MKVRTQGQVVKMVVILVEEEKMREMLVVVPWVVVMFFGMIFGGMWGVICVFYPLWGRGIWG